MSNRLSAAVLCCFTLAIASCGQEEPTCTDGLKNGTETDVDCGGSCGACANGKACAAPGDCESGSCKALVCAAPSCDDQAKNGDETDVDCGGSCSVKCAADRACSVPADCASGRCESGACLPAPRCDDNEKNGNETDVDCGGDRCGPCGDGKVCGDDLDCDLGLSCQSGRCAPKPLTCGEGFLCVANCSGPTSSSCQLSCIQRISPAGQGKLLAFIQCSSAACPETGDGVCNEAREGFDAAACEACVVGSVDEGGPCEDELDACLLDG